MEIHKMRYFLRIWVRTHGGKQISFTLCTPVSSKLSHRNPLSLNPQQSPFQGCRDPPLRTTDQAVFSDRAQGFPSWTPALPRTCSQGSNAATQASASCQSVRCTQGTPSTPSPHGKTLLGGLMGQLHDGHLELSAWCWGSWKFLWVTRDYFSANSVIYTWNMSFFHYTG